MTTKQMDFLSSLNKKIPSFEMKRKRVYGNEIAFFPLTFFTFEESCEAYQGRSPDSRP